MASFNISNHKVFAEKTTWTQDQIAAFKEMGGEIVDVGFPGVTPDMTDDQLKAIANEVARDLVGQSNGERSVAMVAGHYAATIYIVAALQEVGISCYIGDSVRVAEEVPQPDGTLAIVHKFKFAGFRKYPAIKIK